MVQKKDKSTNVNLIEANAIKIKNGLKPVDSKDIKITVNNDDLASNLMKKSGVNSKFICYSENNSFLCTLTGHGISVTKNGQEVYSQTLKNGMEHISDVVYCKGSYYIYNDTPGRILRKTEDETEPTIWWDRSRIKYFYNYNCVIRAMEASKNQSAIAINANKSELIVIEIKDDGAAGREIIIQNRTGSRIMCHEPFEGNKILTVNEIGLMVVYEVDLEQYQEYREIDKYYIELISFREENWFFFSFCEFSERVAVLIRNFDSSSRASRIQVYDMKKENSVRKMELKAEVDLWGEGLRYFFSICVSQYVGDKLLIFGYSEKSQKLLAYFFDTETNELTEKVVSSGDFEDRMCYKLQRLGNEVYGLLGDGKIVKINASLLN